MSDLIDHRTPPKGKRVCENWLKTLSEYVEDTEAPRAFWFWAGISAIAGALQRKVWLPFGLETVYPCLYIMIVAPPGECRKGAPVALAKRLVQSVKGAVFADSPTKRALTKNLAELVQKQFFYYVDSEGVRKPKTHCSISLFSKELSSFLAVDAKAMIEILTEIYDPHDEWEYKTSGEGSDKLFGICTNCLFATTPSWLSANLPEEAIGGGFTSRFVIVSGTEKYKWLSYPPVPDENILLDLQTDLLRIKHLVGEFKWSPQGFAYYDKWYMGIEKVMAENRDQRMRGFISRMHTIAIKVAMCLHVAYSDELIIEADDIGRAIDLVQDVLKSGSIALGGHGASTTSVMTDKILRQIQMMTSQGTPISFTELLRLNFHDTNRKELSEVLDTIVAMEVVDVKADANNKPTYLWRGMSKGSGGKRRSSRGRHERRNNED
jgi:hypothetical protein